MSKKTLVMGASPNPSRYSYLATMRLAANNHEVIPFGVRKGEIEGISIVNELPQDNDIDTVTLYLNPQLQEQYYDYIMGLSPKRIIFNPGTENPEFIKHAQDNSIETEIACTLVLLGNNQY